MNRKVKVGECDVGRGVFADAPIAKGEVILFITGRILSRSENARIYLEGENSVQIGHDHYLDPCNPSVYLNHSCDPNAGIDSDLRLIALRDIPAGTEIRFDYSTAMLERSWTMQCRCGSPKCRGLIDDFDRVPQKVREFYLQRNVVQGFIIEELEKAESALPDKERVA